MSTTSTPAGPDRVLIGKDYVPPMAIGELDIDDVVDFGSH